MLPILTVTMLFLLVAVLIYGCHSGFLTYWHRYAGSKRSAFNEMDKNFMALSTKAKASLKSDIWPIITIEGGNKYHLFTSRKEKKTFDTTTDLLPLWDVAKGTSHILVALHYMGYPSWHGHDLDWDPIMRLYLQKMKAALSQLPAAMEAIAALDGKPSYDQVPLQLAVSPEILSDLLETVLSTSIRWCNEVLTRGSYTLSDYEYIASLIANDAAAIMYYTVWTATTRAYRVLNKWRTTLGKSRWDRLWVVVGGGVSGAEGGTTGKAGIVGATRGLSAAYSTTVPALQAHMTKEAVKERIISSSCSLSDADQIVASVIMARAMANAAWATPKARCQSAGLYQDVVNVNRPLALDFVGKTLQQVSLPGLDQDSVLSACPFSDLVQCDR